MNLKQGQNHHTYTVKQIQIETSLERRLEALGLTTDAKITVLNNDKQGSMTVKFRGTRFAIGRRIADHISVEEAAVWTKQSM